MAAEGWAWIRKEETAYARLHSQDPDHHTKKREKEGTYVIRVWVQANSSSIISLSSRLALNILAAALRPISDKEIKELWSGHAFLSFP